METNQMTKKILEFQKGALTSWYDVMASMQEQAASSIDLVLDQSDWLPIKGRQMMQNWLNACKKGCNDYKELMEESIDELEKVLVIKSRKTPVPKKSAAKAKAAAPAKRKAPVAVVKTTEAVAKPVSAADPKTAPATGDAEKTPNKP